MMYPWPAHIVPALVLAVNLMVAQFQVAVPGATARPTSGFRGDTEQAELYAQGRTKPGPIITKAKPGQSKHNHGLAVDMVILCQGKVSWDIRADCDKDGISDYEELGRLGEGLGLVWGGRWKGFPDFPHFEVRQ